MDRLVAVKMVNPRLAANPYYLERFTREAHIAAKLSRNNVVQAIDVDSTGKMHYFVMEYVEGTTITRAGSRQDSRRKKKPLKSCFKPHSSSMPIGVA